MTTGMPAFAAASMRVGPALRVPPQSSSAHSVVVMSSTPTAMPLSMTASIDFPPAPVAAKTSTSYPFSSRMRFASVTQAVVLPNMEATISGLSSETSVSAEIIPQIAPAARAKIVLERRFSPATSATLGIMVMSLVPR